MPHQVDGAVDEDPPRVGVLTAPEEHVVPLEAHLVAGRREVGELDVGEPVEEVEAAQVGRPDHVAAR